MIAWIIILAVLFFVLTPGVLVTLPKKASKMMQAAVHALIFALVASGIHAFYFTQKEGVVVSTTPTAPISHGCHDAACVLL